MSLLDRRPSFRERRQAAADADFGQAVADLRPVDAPASPGGVRENDAGADGVITIGQVND